MKRLALLVSVLGLVMSGIVVADDAKVPKAKALEGTSGVKVVVRAQGPYDADVPLQVVCYFKHRTDGDKALGAAVVLDKRLQKEGLGCQYTLEEWIVEAGPAYFDDTVAGMGRGIAEAKKVVADRPAAPYARKTE